MLLETADPTELLCVWKPHLPTWLSYIALCCCVVLLDSRVPCGSLVWILKINELELAFKVLGKSKVTHNLCWRQYLIPWSLFLSWNRLFKITYGSFLLTLLSFIKWAALVVPYTTSHLLLDSIFNCLFLFLQVGIYQLLLVKGAIVLCRVYLETHPNSCIRSCYQRVILLGSSLCIAKRSTTASVSVRSSSWVIQGRSWRSSWFVWLLFIFSRLIIFAWICSIEMLSTLFPMLLIDIIQVKLIFIFCVIILNLRSLVLVVLSML